MPAVASPSRRFTLCIALRLSFWRGGCFGVRFSPGIAALSMRLTFGARLRVSIAAFCRSSSPAMRFCWDVFPRFTPDIAFLSWCFASVHACCLPHSAKQDGLRYLAFLFRRSRSPFVRSRGVGAVIFLGGFTSGLGVCLWRSRRGCRGDGRCGGRGTGLAARPLCVFARAHWLCCAFRGEYVGGCAPPNLRQRVFDSLDSLHAAAGLGWCGFAGRHPGIRKDPAESNLCSAGSGCITMLPIRTIVQTRAAPKRRRVGLTRAKRCGSGHCPPCAKRCGSKLSLPAR